MPEVTFYQDLAKPNSTHIPTSVVLTGDCLLKHPTDLYNPTIVFNGDVHNATSFKLLGKYYWVTNMVSVRNGVWEVTGKKNLLATYQGSIGLASGFIQYADTADNKFVPDDRLGIKVGDYNLMAMEVNVPFISSTNKYVNVSIVATDHVEEVLMDTTEMNQLLNQFQGAGTSAIQKALGSGQEACINAVRGAFWMPINYDGGTGCPAISTPGGGTIEFGADIDSGVPRRLPPAICWRASEIAITVMGYTDWRNANAILSLTLPLYGNIDIPVSDIVTADLGSGTFPNIPTIYVQYSFNLYSGDYTIEIFKLNSSGGGASVHQTITTVSGNCAVAIPVGASVNNAAPRMIGAMANMIGSAASGNWGSALGSTAEAYGILTHTATTAQPRAISTGGGGNPFCTRNSIAVTLHTRIYTHIDPNDFAVKSTIGVPVMKMGTIAATTALGTGGGYVQGCDLQLTGTMTETEREEIESLFNKGFYYVT